MLRSRGRVFLAFAGCFGVLLPNNPRLLRLRTAFAGEFFV
jgi:hypothetical protein